MTRKTAEKLNGQRTTAQRALLLELIRNAGRHLDADELYQQARGGFSARREYWNAIRASFRLLLFESWDQVLERINSPPQPAFR